MILFDVTEYEDREPVVDIVAVCHRCGARSEPIPSHSGQGGWQEGVLFGIVALTAHELDCPAR